MEKLITSFILFTFLITGCSETDLLSPENQSIYRKIAYNSLDDQSKESIIIDWRDARVAEGTYKSDGDRDKIVINSESTLYFFRDERFTLVEDQKLITVAFNTNADALLGPIIIIIDPKINHVVGFVGRL